MGRGGGGSSHRWRIGALVVLVAAACHGADGERAKATVWRRVDPLAFGPVTETSELSALAASGDGLPWLATGTLTEPGGRDHPVVWSAADGRTWARAALDIGAAREGSARAVARRGGRAVVGGSVIGREGDRDGALWSSTDGRSWRRLRLDGLLGGHGDQEVTALVGGPVGFVATGETGGADERRPAVWVSADGESWRRVGAGDKGTFAPGQAIAAVAAGTGGVVAAGTDRSGPDADVAVWFSPDGGSWERRPLDPAVFAGPDDQVALTVTATTSGFLAGGHDSRSGREQPAVWLSPDGRNWAPAPASLELSHGPGFGGNYGISMQAVAGNGPVVAIGASPGDVQVWASLDGRGWARQEPPSFRTEGDEVAGRVAVAGKATLVALSGPPQPELWFQPRPGEEWVDVSGDAEVFPGPGPDRLASALFRNPAGGFIAVGSQESGDDDEALVWASADGRAWEPGPDPESLDESRIDSVRAGRGGVMAAGVLAESRAEAAAWTSPDGRQWARSTAFPPPEEPRAYQQLTDIAEGGPGVVAVGLTYSPETGINAHIWTSPDGGRWDRVPAPSAWTASDDQIFQAICPVPGGLVALGYTKAGPKRRAWAWTSADGRVWTEATGPAAAALTEGIAGISRCETTGLGVIALGRRGIGDTGDAGVVASADGRTWRRLDHDPALGGPGDQAAVAAAADGERLVVVGVDGDAAAVWTSFDGGRHWKREADPSGSLSGYGRQAASSVVLDGSRVLVMGNDGPRVAVWEGELPLRTR